MGDGDTRETRAILKGVLTYFSDAIGDGDTRETPATIKGIFFYFSDAIGMVTLVRPVQSLKACSPITVTLSGMVTLVEILAPKGVFTYFSDFVSHSFAGHLRRYFQLGNVIRRTTEHPHFSIRNGFVFYFIACEFHVPYFDVMLILMLCHLQQSIKLPILAIPHWLLTAMTASFSWIVSPSPIKLRLWQGHFQPWQEPRRESRRCRFPAICRGTPL
jgi:hypothetical protein